MQIDFHHGATYVIARYAGFDVTSAETIAYAAQYVDDATNEGALNFDNEAAYRRLATAHKMIDYRHLRRMKSRLVWVPFHFLPGNDGLPAGEDPEGEFIKKLICRPNSHVARDMVAACIADRNKSYGLHRLGITAHVFVDTWAHQGFAGVDHAVNAVNGLRWGINNEVDTIYETKHKQYFSHSADNVFDRIRYWFKRNESDAPAHGEKPWEAIWDLFLHLLRSDLPALGHGQALSYPDRPYLEQWTYTNGLSQPVTRRNLDEFTDAAVKLCEVFQRYRADDPQAPVPGLTQTEIDKIREMLKGTTPSKGEDRHTIWLDAIKGDYFGFGAAELTYAAKGTGSWKYAAVKTLEVIDMPGYKHPYNSSFLTSNWKMFHDAAKAHRLCVVDEILPKYGIVAA
ncbi:MAG: hypothetical protein O2944_04975 [Proteobacteria bacterium]|nr:hypothetical protein [Pseudomonadota bacterium]